METNQFEILARIVLPSELLDYFEIVSVEQTSTEIHIHLDELMNPSLSCDVHFESKGFIRILQPKHIVLLGITAFQQIEKVIGSNKDIEYSPVFNNIKSQIGRINQIPTVCVPHPSAGSKQ